MKVTILSLLAVLACVDARPHVNSQFKLPVAPMQFMSEASSPVRATKRMTRRFPINPFPMVSQKKKDSTTETKAVTGQLPLQQPGPFSSPPSSSPANNKHQEVTKQQEVLKHTHSPFTIDPSRGPIGKKHENRHNMDMIDHQSSPVVAKQSNNNSGPTDKREPPPPNKITKMEGYDGTNSKTSKVPGRFNPNVMKAKAPVAGNEAKN